MCPSPFSGESRQDDRSVFVLPLQKGDNLFEIAVVDFSARDIVHPARHVLLDIQATLPQHVG